MKHLALLLALLPALLVNAQKDKTITLSCRLDGCPSPLRLFQFDGLVFKQVAEASSPSPDGSYTFTLPATASPQFYYLGTRSDQTLIVLLGTEAQVQVNGPCADVRQATIQNSPLNTHYNSIKNRINVLKAQTSQLIQQYQMHVNNPEQLKNVIARMKDIDDQKLTLLDSLNKTNPYFAGIAALNTYLSWPNNQGSYTNEIDYFAKEYFRYVDFKDAKYEGLPWVYEAFQGYANTLANVGLSDNAQKAYLEQVLQKIPKGTLRYRMALAGSLVALKQKNSSHYVYFAEELLKQLKEGDEASIASLQQQIASMRSFTIGAEAPDFAQATPEGKILRLSDLRGKVVLVDFWASWCGPCRRENPNVVRLYNTYKSKGFEILGVSLDRDRQRWLDAIKEDGLTWYHVSDLQQWSNAAALLYGVNSIPHTVLVDKDGKIIARNLRGEALEHKLAEIFLKG